MIERYYHNMGTTIYPTTHQNKYRNSYKLVTVDVIIINDGKNMN